MKAKHKRQQERDIEKGKKDRMLNLFVYVSVFLAIVCVTILGTIMVNNYTLEKEVNRICDNYDNENYETYYDIGNNAIHYIILGKHYLGSDVIKMCEARDE